MMLPYYIAFALSISLVCLKGSDSRLPDSFERSRSSDSRLDEPRFHSNAVGVLASAVVLVSLAGLRDGVGTDFYDIYVTQFDWISQGVQADWEPGLTWLARGVLVFSNDYHWLFFVSALLTVGLTYCAILRVSSDFRFHVFVLCFGGFFFFSLNGVRQSIAVAFFLLAITDVVERKPFRFVVLVFFASLFHISAAFLLPIYPLALIVRKTSSFVVMPLIVGGAAYSLNRLSSLLPAKYLAKFSTGEETFSGNFDYQGLILCSLPIVILLLARLASHRDPAASLESESPFFRVFLLLSSLGVVCAILSGSVFIMYRMVTYFSASLILSLPIAIRSTDNGRLRFILSMFVILLLMAYTQFVFGFKNQSNVLPYFAVF